MVHFCLEEPCSFRYSSEKQKIVLYVDTVDRDNDELEKKLKDAELNVREMLESRRK